MLKVEQVENLNMSRVEKVEKLKNEDLDKVGCGFAYCLQVFLRNAPWKNDIHEI